MRDEHTIEWVLVMIWQRRIMPMRPDRKRQAVKPSAGDERFEIDPEAAMFRLLDCNFNARNLANADVATRELRSDRQGDGRLRSAEPDQRAGIDQVDHLDP